MKKERSLLILALCALILISGCGTSRTDPPAVNAPPAADTQDEQPSEVQETESSADTEEIQADDAPVVESEDEAAYCVFPDVEALTDAIHTEQEAFWKDPVARGNRLEDVSAVYVPARDYEGFRLFQVAVNPYYIFSYYVPLDSAFDMLFDPEDIVITQSRSREMTLESVCAQNGISPDAEGYAYSAQHGDLFFERDGTVIFISAPEGMNDYDSLRALCDLERVDIARSEPPRADLYEEFGESAIYAEVLGGDQLRAFEQAVSERGLEFHEAARQYCTDLTEVGDGAAFTYTDRIKDGDSSYNLSVARLRNRCYDENLTTLAGRVASQYQRFREGSREVFGPGPGRGQSRQDEELIYDLTGLTVFHPALSGVSVHVTVNETDCGEFALADGKTCTFIPLDLPAFVADRPVQINLWSVNLPKDAEIQVYAGLDSNVSRGI